MRTDPAPNSPGQTLDFAAPCQATADQRHPEPMKQSILVVEDETSIADNIVYALEGEGYAVEAFGTGEEALDELGEEEYDLIILDVGLPDTTGFDLCREIRKDRDIPVIFLTARSSEVDRIVGLELGADDYMVKPFSPRELGARARAVLRRYNSQPGSPDGPQPEDSGEGDRPLWIDEERCQAKYYGEAVTLSATEFRLLRAFVRHPGRVYSRAQLMNIAWDDPGAAMERTVDAHIKSLRAKLRDVRPDPDAIVTHRGLGYSLREEW